MGALAASRSVALARIWLQDRGVLALAGSAGTPSGGGSYSRLDGEFRQFAVSDARILDIASTRQPAIVRSIRGDEDWLNASWATRQGVRAFVGLPLIAGDLVTGVVALFDRELPDDGTLADLQFVTAVAAARLADLGAREPTTPPSATSIPPGKEAGHSEARRPLAGTEIVITRAELRQIERQNIEAALAQTGGRVFGPGGAAAVLKMKPTTLASRIKTLGISRHV